MFPHSVLLLLFLIKPHIILSKVDFPQPDGPTMAIERQEVSKERLLKIVFPVLLKAKDRLCTIILISHDKMKVQKSKTELSFVL
jgi:hypothetical protein